MPSVRTVWDKVVRGAKWPDSPSESKLHFFPGVILFLHLWWFYYSFSITVIFTIATIISSSHALKFSVSA